MGSTETSVCQGLTFHNRVPVHPCDEAYLLCYDGTLLRTFRNITDPQIRRNQRDSGKMWTLPQSGKHWSRQKKKRNGWQADGRMRTHMLLPLYDRRPGAGESLVLGLNRRRSVSLAGMTAELFHRWAGWACVLTCLPPLLTGRILLQLNTPVAKTK